MAGATGPGGGGDRAARRLLDEIGAGELDYVGISAQEAARQALLRWPLVEAVARALARASGAALAPQTADERARTRLTVAPGGGGAAGRDDAADADGPEVEDETEAPGPRSSWETRR